MSFELRVRRFFCTIDACGQRIFIGQLPNTVGRYGRRTCRLSAALNRITLALGGSAGSRLARQLGILADGPTLLRKLRRWARRTPSLFPFVVGIHDWAWTKGQRFCTVVCHLKRGQVIDSLPDRSAESTAAWLRAHPHVEILSRDRASLYAEAATRTAPQAVQVADRWHLIRNLSEALVSVLIPQHRVIDQAARTVFTKPALPSIELPRTEPMLTRAQRAKQQHMGKRWLLLTRWVHLTARKKQQLNGLFAINWRLFKDCERKGSLDRLMELPLRRSDDALSASLD